MTYQPKSYRKFVATAATATLVATAFAPFASAHSFKDVETKYEEAVNFLVSKGVSGYADGTFKTQKTITRIEAAEMLGKALGLDKVTDAPASGFTDVPERVVTLINAFKAKGITTGKTATTFAPNAEITRGELAVWIQKAYDLKAKEGSTNKFTDVADNYKAAVQALVDNKITSGTSETTFGTTESAKRGDFALFVKKAADAAVVKEVAVESVSAINADKISVKFNQKVDDTKAKFEVKRGSVTEEVKVTWNEEKTEATLTRSSAFVAGDYTVTVTGIEGLQESVKTLTIEKEEIKSVSINTTQLQKSATAPLSVDFINQYGQKSSVAATDSKLTITAYNKTKSQKLDLVSNKFEINAASADLKDEVVVTVMYNGVTVTKTLTVVAPATVGAVSLGDVVLPTGKTQLTPNTTKDVEVKYTAKNTLDEEYTLKSSDVTSGAVQFLSSDSTILDANDVSIDSEGKIKIAMFKKSGTVELKAFTPATGAISSVSINVKDDAGVVTSVELEKSEVSFAAGKTDNLYVGLTVKDNYGTVIATKDLKESDYTITSDNPDVVNNDAELKLITTGDNAGKIQIKPANADIKKGKSATITVLVKSTGQKSTVKVTADEAAVVTAIDLKENVTVPSNLLVGGTTELEYSVKDQYGNVISSSESGYTVEYKSSDDKVLKVTSVESGDAINAAAVTIKAEKAGKATIKAILKKGEVAIAEKSVTITTIANDSTAEYSIAKIASVYKEELNSTLAGATIQGDIDTPQEKKAAVESGYAEEISITAKTADGVTVQVPTSAIANFTLTPVKKADNSGETTGKLKTFEYNGKYYVYVSTAFAAADFEKADKSTVDLTTKVEATINMNDDVKVLTQDITISKEDAIAQSVVFKDIAWTADTAKNAVDVTDLDLKNLGSLANADNQKAFVWVEDQFGGYTAVTPTLSVVGVDGVTSVSGSPSINDGVINLGTLVFEKNDAKFRLIAKSGSKTDFINFTMKDGILPTAAATDAVKIEGTYAAKELQPGSKITFKFSEKLAAGDKDANKTAIIAAIKSELDADNVDVTANADLTEFTATVKEGKSIDLTSAKTVTVTSTNVVDLAGNVASANVVFTVPAKK